MDQRMIIVCLVVGSLGVLSAILGFSAEGTKLTGHGEESGKQPLDEKRVVREHRSEHAAGAGKPRPGGGVCLYPQNPALGLGVCAVIFLVVAQIIFAAVGGCCGCCKSRTIPSETNRIIGVVCAVFSWITAIIAFALLVTGAAWNATGTRDPSPFGLCYVLKDGILAGGAVLTLVATALAVTSYVMLRRQPATAASAAAAAPKEGEQMPAGAAGITMGRLQFPQQPPQGQGYGQAPPNYPQHSPPPQGQGYGQAPNPHYAPPPAQGQGYGAHAPNQQQQQLPPPARGYGQYPPHEQV